MSDRRELTTDDEPFDGDYGEGESCWYCMGDCGFHECFEDTCFCLNPDELNEICPECHGSGVL